MMPGKRFQALWLVLAFTVAGCATVSTGPESRYSTDQLQQIGEKFLAAGSYGQALKYLTMAESRRPNDPDVQYALARAYELRGLPSQALLHYQKALTLKPDFSEARNALGAFYAKQNELDKAAREFEKVAADPFYATPHVAFYNLGLIFEKQGYMEAALKQYEEAVRLQPSYAVAHFRMGQVFENLHREKEARDAYGKAIRYYPDLTQAQLRYGILSYMAGDRENALLALRHVVRVEPRSSMATEAKKYLNRLEPAAAADGASYDPISSAEVRSQIEAFINQDARDQEQRRSSGSDKKTSETKSEANREPGVMLDLSYGRQVEPESATSIHAGTGRQGHPKPITSIEGEARSVKPGKEEAKASPLQHDSPAGADSRPAASRTETEEAQEAHGARALRAEAKNSTPSPGNIREGDIQDASRWSYIVQIGSFLEREKAESVEKEMKEKGFEVASKAVSDPIFGEVHVVQMAPVSNAAEAEELLSRIESDGEVNPIIIRSAVSQ